MELIKCLVVDDEPLGRDVLEKYISNTPALELTGVCRDGFEANQFIQNNEIDIIFLDINMPKLSGLSFVRTLHNAPKIVFVTAYPEYAVEGFEVSAVDYLVKPVSVERFMKAVNKVIEIIKNEKEDKDSIFIKVDKKLVKVELNDIYFIEAYGDFLKVHTAEKSMIISETMKGFEERLPGRKFLRIHKSYIINLDKIDFIESSQVKIKNEFLPIGATYKEEFTKRIKMN